MSSELKSKGPVRPPAALPEFVAKPPGPPSGLPSGLLPPRPPVLNPVLVADGKRSNTTNPFAAKPTNQKPATDFDARSRQPLPESDQPKPVESVHENVVSELKTEPAVEKASLAPAPLPSTPSSVEKASLAPAPLPSTPSSVEKASLAPAPLPSTPSSVEKASLAPAPLPSTPSSKEPGTEDANAESSPQVEAGAKENTGEDRVDMSGGLMGWLTKTMNESKLLSDVAERAKHGMEQVLTTLDPGMKGFLSEDGVVDVYIVAGDREVTQAIRDGFERVFANVIIRATPAAQGDLPVLVHGAAAALAACQTRATRLVQSKLVPAGEAILVAQPFLMDIDERTYSATRILLKWKEHEMDSISQLLEVDSKLLEHVQTRSSADSQPVGVYSVTLSQAANQLSGGECESWSGEHPPFSSPGLLTGAVSSVAQQFMNLNIRLTTQSTIE